MLDTTWLVNAHIFKLHNLNYCHRFKFIHLFRRLNDILFSISCVVGIPLLNSELTLTNTSAYFTLLKGQ